MKGSSTALCIGAPSPQSRAVITAPPQAMCVQYKPRLIETAPMPDTPQHPKAAPDATQGKPKRQRRIPERIELSDESCKPGLGLMERIAHTRKPTAEDLAIVDAWQCRFPVRVATAKELAQWY